MELNSQTLPALMDAYRAAISAGGTIVKDATNQAGYVQAHALQAYNLDQPAKLLYPITTPLRNRIARNVISPVSDVARWRAFSAINTAAVWGSVAENSIGTVLGTTDASKSVTLKQIAALNWVGLDALIYGASFQDLKALNTLQTMQTLMTMEEDLIIGGNTTALGTFTSTIVATEADTGGTLLANTQYSYRVAALTLEALRQDQAGLFTGTGATVTGSTACCANVNETTTNDGNNTHMHTLAWDEMAGAVAYAVYQGIAAANYKLVDVVTTNSLAVTARPSGDDVTLPSNDGTANANDYDGLVRLLNSSGTATITSLDNAALAADGAGGIDAISTACQSQFDSYGVGPDMIICNGAMAKRLSAVVGGSSAPLHRIDISSGDSQIRGGVKFASVLNPVTGEDIEILTHRKMPANMIIGLRLKSPYEYAQLGTSVDMALARDYYTLDVASPTLTDGAKMPITVRCNGALRLYSGMGSFVLSNVKATA